MPYQCKMIYDDRCSCVMREYRNPSPEMLPKLQPVIRNAKLRILLTQHPSSVNSEPFINKALTLCNRSSETQRTKESMCNPSTEMRPAIATLVQKLKTAKHEVPTLRQKGNRKRTPSHCKC